MFPIASIRVFLTCWVFYSAPEIAGRPDSTIDILHMKPSAPYTFILNWAELSWHGRFLT